MTALGDALARVVAGITTWRTTGGRAYDQVVEASALLVEEPFGRRLARRFHEEYEAAAPHYGYETRPESAVPYDDLPEPHQLLMEHVCRAITSDIKAHCIAAMEASRDREPEAASASRETGR